MALPRDFLHVARPLGRHLAQLTLQAHVMQLALRELVAELQQLRLGSDEFVLLLLEGLGELTAQVLSQNQGHCHWRCAGPIRGWSEHAALRRRLRRMFRVAD